MVVSVNEQYINIQLIKNMERKHIALASASVLIISLLGYFVFTRAQKVTPKDQVDESDEAGEAKEEKE